MSTPSTNYTVLGTQFSVPASETEQTDITLFMINALAALEGHTHNGTDRGALVAGGGVAAAGTLTGATLAAGVLASSLTSVGTLSALTVSGNLTMTAAASRILGGATSFAVRNNANSADNLLISDAGAATVRAGLTVTASNVTLAGANTYVSFAKASLAESWRIGDGVSTSDGVLSFYNVVGGALRASLTAAGLLTVAAGVVVTAGGVVVTAGGLIVTDTGLKVTAGNTYLGASVTNASQTLGLTVNQGAADDESVSLKSSDVAHGMTVRTETDTYGDFRKAVATTGGLQVRGSSSGAAGLVLIGAHATGDTTKSAVGVGVIRLQASLKATTSYGANGANENLLVVVDHGSTRAIIDTEGDLHLDATSNINAWDDHDDIALLEAFRVVTANPVNFRQRFATDVAAHAQVLHDTGVITLNEVGPPFVSVKGMFGLLIDALRQVGGRVEDQAAEISDLRTQLALKEG